MIYENIRRGDWPNSVSIREEVIPELVINRPRKSDTGLMSWCIQIKSSTRRGRDGRVPSELRVASSCYARVPSEPRVAPAE